MDFLDWLLGSSGDAAGTAVDVIDWGDLAGDAVGNTAADFAGMGDVVQGWSDWGSLADSVGNTLSDFGWDWNSLPQGGGGLGLSDAYQPWSVDGVVGGNMGPAGLITQGDIGFAPDPMDFSGGAEVVAPGGTDYTMTPNERAARLASVQRSADGMGGQRLGVSNSAGSAWDRFVEKGTAAAKDPMTYVRAGLAWAGGAGETPTGPRNTQAAFNTYSAEDAAARAENAGLRTRQNNTTDTLVQSAGPDAYKSGMNRAANQTAALQRQLGYTNAPKFVQDALLAKQNSAGLRDAQTAYTSAQASANKNARYEMAPGGNPGLVTAASQLDNANRNAQNDRAAQYVPIGQALEDIFGTKKAKAEETSAQEVPT